MKLYFRTDDRTQILSEAGGKLGRAEGSAIHLPDPSVSSNHAEFFWDGQMWWILPLTDKNPVLRNGVRLPGAKVPLGLNGRLQFGHVQVTFYVEGQEPKADVAAPADWQRLRIKDPPVNLPPRNPPIVDLSLNQAATLIQTRPRSAVPQTILSIPTEDIQNLRQPAVPVTQVSYTPVVPPMRPPQPVPETQYGRPANVTPVSMPIQAPPERFPPPPPLAVPPQPIVPEPAVPSGRGELLRQAGLLIALLALICVIGFYAGIWVLG